VNDSNDTLIWLIITAALVLVAGFAGYGIASQQIHREAVKTHNGHWHVDDDGITHFEWNIEIPNLGAKP
jgi:hypothetical protein